MKIHCQRPLFRELYEEGKRLLSKGGYREIGMDHFGKPSSYLFQSKEEKKLNRNFMGYVDKKANVLIGLGPTAISDSRMSFAQNEKSIKYYEERLSRGMLPIEKGHVQSQKDLEAQRIILELMCEEQTILSDSYNGQRETQGELNGFEEDGIIERESQMIQITEIGKPFSRNVAMTFDHHLRAKTEKVKISQTI